MQQYKYSDGTIGPARQLNHNGQIFPSHYLSRRSAETEAEWIARIGVIGARPVRYEAWAGDINSQYMGDAVETETDGWLVIGYPALDKVPLWSTTTRERMYILPGAEVPPCYTASEPMDGVYSSWTGEAWEYNADLKAGHVRSDRDRRLADCDWTQLPDSPLDETAQAAWVAYRQALRDVPAQAGFPDNVTWPEQPEA